MTKDHILRYLRGGLIVSCQALPNEPLYGSDIMAKLAVAAVQGGAVGIRANTPDDIRAIRAVVDVPIIGLWKVDVEGYEVYITPRVRDAASVAEAGADIIAVDATDRIHPEGTVKEFIHRVKNETSKLVMADISTFDEGVAARDAGADFVSTTMSGYTSYSVQQAGPDMELVARLAEELGAEFPLTAEGRISTPEQMRELFESGAFAVVVGGAITRPQQITARFVGLIPGRRQDG